MLTQAREYRLAVVQVLAVQRRMLAVRGVPAGVGEVNHTTVVMCQPLELWGSGDMDMARQELEVFVLQEPQKLDL